MLLPILPKFAKIGNFRLKKSEIPIFPIFPIPISAKSTFISESGCPPPPYVGMRLRNRNDEIGNRKKNQNPDQ